MTRMRPGSAGSAAAASAQNGDRPSPPAAPSTTLPKPARRRSRRAIPPRRDVMGMLVSCGAASAKLELRGTHDQMRQQAQRPFEIARGKFEIVGAELLLQKIDQVS